MIYIYIYIIIYIYKMFMYLTVFIATELRCIMLYLCFVRRLFHCCTMLLYCIIYCIYHYIPLYTIIYVDPPSTHKIGILPHMFCTCTYFFNRYLENLGIQHIYIYEYIHVTEQGMVRGHGLRLASTSPEWSGNWIGEVDNYPRIAELHRTSKVSELFYTVYVFFCPEE